MKTEIYIRNQIIKKIQRFPHEKLKELNEFVSKLEGRNRKKSKVLSYAGTWEDIDESTFEELTKNLISRRQRNNRRINE